MYSVTTPNKYYNITGTFFFLPNFLLFFYFLIIIIETFIPCIGYSALPPLATRAPLYITIIDYRVQNNKLIRYTYKIYKYRRNRMPVDPTLRNRGFFPLLLLDLLVLKRRRARVRT